MKLTLLFINRNQLIYFMLELNLGKIYVLCMFYPQLLLGGSCRPLLSGDELMLVVNGVL